MNVVNLYHINKTIKAMKQKLFTTLELYCPLDNGDLTNLAQSTNKLELFTDEETPLEEVKNQMANDQMVNAYTVLGRPADPSFRGTVLIIDGKKVLR